jgi:hypothetical protein
LICERGPWAAVASSQLQPRWCPSP